MTITITEAPFTVEAGSATSVTSSPSYTSTSGNLLIATCAVDGESSEGTTPWTDSKSNSWTHSKSSNFGSDPTYGAFAFAKNITGGTGQTVTYTAGAAGGFFGLGVMEIAGCDTTSPNDVATSWVGQEALVSHTLTSALITPSAGDHLIVAACLLDQSLAGLTPNVVNAGTGTAIWTFVNSTGATGEPVLLAYTIVAADGSHTYGITLDPGNSPGNQNRMIIGVAAFKAAAASIGPFPLPRPWIRRPSTRSVLAR